MTTTLINLNLLDKKSDNLKKCICVENNNEIYKFKVIFNHMDVVNAIEDYVKIINVYDFEVVSEETLESKGMIKKFFPPLGKFRLEGNSKATNNYFAPPKTVIFETLFSMYRNDVLTELDFIKLENEYSLAINNQDESVSKFIKNFLDKMNVELLDKYTLEELNTSLNCLERLSAESRLSKTYSSLKHLLEVSVRNRNRIVTLELSDKFNQIIKNPQANQIIKK